MSFHKVLSLTWYTRTIFELPIQEVCLASFFILWL
jgi:hypothetical protein